MACGRRLPTLKMRSTECKAGRHHSPSRRRFSSRPSASLCANKEYRTSRKSMANMRNSWRISDRRRRKARHCGLACVEAATQVNKEEKRLGTWNSQSDPITHKLHCGRRRKEAGASRIAIRVWSSTQMKVLKRKLRRPIGVHFTKTLAWIKAWPLKMTRDYFSSRL